MLSTGLSVDAQSGAAVDAFSGTVEAVGIDGLIVIWERTSPLPSPKWRATDAFGAYLLIVSLISQKYCRLELSGLKRIVSHPGPPHS